MRRGGLFPQTLSVCHQLYLLFYPPGSTALSGAGTRVAPPVAELGPSALRKRGPRVPAERCPEATEAGEEELGVSVAMA